jgi:maltose O-acetyltransferase
MRPLTEADPARRHPSALRRYVGEVLDRTAWVSPTTSFPIPVSLRRGLLRLAGFRIGAKVTGLKQCVFQSNQVSIGDGSFVNMGCQFEGFGRVDIGRDVFLGPQVMILTSTHEIDEDGQVTRAPAARPVRVGDRCWLGARATVLPGVTIGEGTIIGAGAVVTKDCDPGALYVGVPARRVRWLGKRVNGVDAWGDGVRRPEGGNLGEFPVEQVHPLHQTVAGIQR